MPATLRNIEASAKGHSLDLRDADELGEVQQLDLARRLLNEVIDDSGWKLEALAAKLGKDPSYFSKMRSGEKPWSLGDICRLPDDIEIKFKTKWIEAGTGAIVVQPVTEDEARRQLATGLISLLTPRKSFDRQAKAGLR